MSPGGEPASELDRLRRQTILSGLAGAPILFCFSIAWIAAALLTGVVPPSLAPWLYVFVAWPAIPAGIFLERRFAYAPAPDPDPLLPLTLQLLFVQIVSFPAVLIVWDVAPAYLPAAFAALVGGHFLPYAWVYRTNLYVWLGIAVALPPYLLAGLRGARALRETGFVVGPVLLVGAFLALAHARRTRRAEPDAPPIAPSATGGA